MPTFAVLAASWIVVAAAELAFSALFSDTALRNDQLALGARISVVAYSLALLMAGVCAIGGLLFLLSRLRPADVHPAVKWTVRSLQALVVFIAVLLYGSSWALFWNTGVFVDRQAFAFLALNGVQIYHWVYPPLAIAGLVGTLVGSAALGWWVPHWIWQLKPDLNSSL